MPSQGKMREPILHIMKSLVLIIFSFYLLFSNLIIEGKETFWTRIILFRKKEGSYRLYQQLSVDCPIFFWILIIIVISNLILNLKILISLFYMKISQITHNLCFVGVYYIIKRTTVSLTWKYYLTFLF